MWSLSIGTLGLILGYALGAVNLYYTLQIVHQDIAACVSTTPSPTSVTLALVPTILVSAFRRRDLAGESQCGLSRGGVGV
jgi:hypothetical protein